MPHIIELAGFRIGFATGLVITQKRIVENAKVTADSPRQRPNRTLGQNFERGERRMLELGTGNDPIVLSLLQPIDRRGPWESPIVGSTPEQVVCDHYGQLNLELGSLLFGVPLTQAIPILPLHPDELKTLVGHFSPSPGGALSVWFRRYFEEVTKYPSLPALGMRLFMTQAGHSTISDRSRPVADSTGTLLASERRERDVLDLIRRRPDIGLQEILREVGGSKSIGIRLVNELIARGQVVRRDRGKRSRYRLAGVE